MKPHLLAPADSAESVVPAQWGDVSRDLGLDTLFDAMAGGDEYVRAVVARVIGAAAGAGDATVIAYRQAAISDALAHPRELDDLYGIVLEAIATRKQHFFGLDMLGRYAGSTLHGAIGILQSLMTHLRRLRDRATEVDAAFSSLAFRDLFGQLRSELSDDWMADAQGHLATLQFRDGMMFRAGLGPGNGLVLPVLYSGSDNRSGWLGRLLHKVPSEYEFRLHPRDEAGARALSELRDRAINEVANAVAQAAQHIFTFLDALRSDLAFHIGCVRLADRLRTLEVPICLPQFSPPTTPQLRARALRDPTLALIRGRAPEANDFDADRRRLLVVTGANQGGKSTFLRSLGVAQIMLQAGMFVAATSYVGTLSAGVFTHFKREEDPAMQGGKLDEELVRMSAIADHIRPAAIWLSNESFSSTNEREGSQLLLDVVGALGDRGIFVWMVTHLFDAARRLNAMRRDDALFLRAPRADGGVRTFRLEVGEPQQTSYGADLYAEVFGNDDPGEQKPASRSAGET